MPRPNYMLFFDWLEEQPGISCPALKGLSFQLLRPTSELDCSIRLANGMRYARWEYMWQLVLLKPEDIPKARYSLGRKHIREIREFLNAMGLDLEMELTAQQQKALNLVCHGSAADMPFETLLGELRAKGLIIEG